jgi:molybdopterin synthase sulfur carrier subunit
VVDVEIKIFATLRKYVPGLGIGEKLRLSLGDSTTLNQLVEQLGIPRSEIKVIMVNNYARPTDYDYVLADGDRLAIFPPVGGG